MSSTSNPYSPPAANVADIREPGTPTQFAVPGATVDTGRGASWIGEGWSLFKAAPLMWMVAMIVLLAIQIALGLIPVLGSIISMLIGPMFMVGVLAFAHGIAQNNGAEIGSLFAGFKDRMGSLVGIALLYLVLVIVAMALTLLAAYFIFDGAQLFSAASPEEGFANMLRDVSGTQILLLVLIMMALMLPVVAAYWFAPGLVFFAGLGVGDAMKQSLSASLRNWLPFLVYGLLSILVMLLGTLALVIGLLLVAMPVLVASYYASFRDIFGQKA